jgi:hypothetical protein
MSNFHSASCIFALIGPTAIRHQNNKQVLRVTTVFHLDLINGLPAAFGATDFAIKPASTTTVTT